MMGVCGLSTENKFDVEKKFILQHYVQHIEQRQQRKKTTQEPHCVLY